MNSTKSRGGRKRSTWPKGQKPPVQKPKGSKHKLTILKESLGFHNWDRLVSFVNNEGAEKWVEEIMQLSGKDFSFAMSQVAEFVKPKLQRTTIEGNPQKPLTLVHLLEGLDLQTKKKILEHIRNTKQ